MPAQYVSTTLKWLPALLTDSDNHVLSSLPKSYSMLTEHETLELADAIVESICQPTPADRMFGAETETAGTIKPMSILVHIIIHPLKPNP